jgi:aminoglycoside phosphotransferase (APT) family kinase protein
VIPARPVDIDPAWLGALLGRTIRGVAHETIGAGFGFVGVVARLTLDADGAPPSVVAKWCDAKGARAEERFAAEVAPTLTIPLARVLACAVEGERGVLLLDDVAPATQGDVLVGATTAQADALVDTMASFHARHWGAADAALASLRTWGDGAEDRIRRTMEALGPFLDECGARPSPAGAAAARALPERLAPAYDALRHATSTLIHADLHLDNVLFRPDGTPVVLDWTDAARGPAAADLGRLVLDGLPPERWTRQARRDVLARYAAAMAARGVGADADALLADVGRMATVALASYVRTVGRGTAKLPDHPRVPIVVEREIRCFADAAAELWPG